MTAASVGGGSDLHLHSADAPNIATVFVLSLLLAFLFPSLVCATTDGRAGTQVLPGWLLMSYSGFRLSVIASMGRRQWAMMLFHTFVYVAFGAYSLASSINQIQPSHAVLDARELAYAHCIIWLGIGAFEAGYKLLSRAKPRRIITKPCRANPFVINSLMAAATLGSFAVIVAFGIEAFLVGHRDSGPEFRISVSDPVYSHLLLGSANTLVVVSLLYALGARRLAGPGSATPHRHGLSLFLLCALIFCTLVLFNPMKMPRYVTAIPFLSTTVFWFRPGRRGITIGILCAVLGFALLFPSLDPRRVFSMPSGRRAATWTSNVMHPGQLITTTDFDAFNMVGATAAVVQHEGVVYGENLLMAAFYFIPRRVWEHKFAGTPTHVVGFVAPEASRNVSAPLWAEAYLAFGWIGLISMMGLYGAFCAWCDDAFLRPRDDWAGISHRVAASIICATMIITLRGSIVTGVCLTMPALVLCYIVAKLLGVGSRKRPPEY